MSFTTSTAYLLSLHKYPPLPPLLSRDLHCLISFLLHLPTTYLSLLSPLRFLPSSPCFIPPVSYFSLPPHYGPYPTPVLSLPFIPPVFSHSPFPMCFFLSFVLPPFLCPCPSCFLPISAVLPTICHASSVSGVLDPHLIDATTSSTLVTVLGNACPSQLFSLRIRPSLHHNISWLLINAEKRLSEVLFIRLFEKWCTSKK